MKTYNVSFKIVIDETGSGDPVEWIPDTIKNLLASKILRSDESTKDFIVEEVEVA